MLSVGQSMRKRRGLLHWMISDSGATSLTARTAAQSHRGQALATAWVRRTSVLDEQRQLPPRKPSLLRFDRCMSEGRPDRALPASTALTCLADACLFDLLGYPTVLIRSGLLKLVNISVEGASGTAVTSSCDAVCGKQQLNSPVGGRRTVSYGRY